MQPFKDILEQNPAADMRAAWKKEHGEAPLWSEAALYFLEKARPVTGDLIDFCLESKMNRWDALRTDPKKCDEAGRTKLAALLHKGLNDQDELAAIGVRERWPDYVQLGLINTEDQGIKDALERALGHFQANPGASQWAEMCVACAPLLSDKFHAEVLALVGRTVEAGHTGQQARQDIWLAKLLADPRTDRSLGRERLEKTNSSTALLELLKAMPLEKDLAVGKFLQLFGTEAKALGDYENALLREVIKMADKRQKSEILTRACGWAGLSAESLDAILKSGALLRKHRVKLLANPDKNTRVRAAGYWAKNGRPGRKKEVWRLG